MCIRDRITKLREIEPIRNIEQLPADIKLMVNCIKIEFREKYDYIPKISECLFLISHGLDTPGKCVHPDCNNYAKFSIRHDNYKYCSRTCSDNDPDRNRRIQQARLPKN